MEALNSMLPLRGRRGMNNAYPYVMDSTDSGFLSTVKKMLSGNYYHELFTLDNHLLHLDSIRKHLSMMLAAEKRGGVMNWALRENVNEVDSLLGELQKLKNGMFGRL